MRLYLWLLLLFIGSSSYGDKHYEHSSTKESQYSHNDVASMAILWGLTKEEIIRYQEIINGPLGKWNKNIDPIMALGIYAKNETDRKRYAELYAMQEFQLTEMTQHFQREYDKAFKQLFPGARIIDPVLLQPYYEKRVQKDLLSGRMPNSAFQSGDKVLYFVDIHCQSCRSQLRRLEKIIANGVKHFVGISIDIYVINANTEEEVRQWAINNNVNIDLVKNTQITLNLDNGLQKQLNVASQQSSDFYLVRDEKTFAINPSHIGL